jgi:hypothetical protein
MTDRTLFPHAFRLRTPAPLWTARALDRCLLFALVYPVATIFVIWIISGQVGPAERALHLPPDLYGGKRTFEAAAVGISILALWRSLQTRGWRAYPWLIIIGICYYAVAGDIFYALVIFGACDIAFIKVGTGAGAFVTALLQSLRRSAMEASSEGGPCRVGLQGAPL